MASPRALCRTPSRCTPNSANGDTPRFTSRSIGPLSARVSRFPKHCQPLRACKYDSAARAQQSLGERCTAANDVEAAVRIVGPVLGRRQLLLSAGGSAIWTVGCPRPANAAGEALWPDDAVVSFPVALLGLSVLARGAADRTPNSNAICWVLQRINGAFIAQRRPTACLRSEHPSDAQRCASRHRGLECS